MTRPPRPATKPADEARRRNVLLEAMGKDIRVAAEAMADIQPKITSIDNRIVTLEADMAIIKPAVQKNTKDFIALRDEVKSMGDTLRTLTNDVEGMKFFTIETKREFEGVKTELRLVRGDVSGFTSRLATVESKLGA